MTVTTTTLHGPNGLTLVLDPTQVFPNDPGAGTPAMVYLRGSSGTYGCVVDTGELDCGRFTLTDAQHRWLMKQEDAVSKCWDDGEAEYFGEDE